MNIQAVVREIYGNKYIYVADGQISRAIQTLTGKKTIDVADIQALQAIGVSVEVFDPYTEYKAE